MATFNPRAARRMHAVLPARGAGLATVDHALSPMPSRPRTPPWRAAWGYRGVGLGVIAVLVFVAGVVWSPGF